MIPLDAISALCLKAEYSKSNINLKIHSTDIEPNSAKILETGIINKNTMIVGYAENEIIVKDPRPWKDKLEELNKLRYKLGLTDAEYDELRQRILDDAFK